MKLTLMCQDDEVAAFELDPATGRVANVQPLAHAAQASLSVRLDGPNPTDDLARFVARRALSPWRTDLSLILSVTRAATTLELALRAHGLSLSDPYWYRTADTRGSWDSLNFFDNSWDPAFGKAVISRDWEALSTASCLVPDVTCTGFAPKAWIQTDSGPQLLKGALGAVGADPAGEVLASRLAALILPSGGSVPYDLVRHDGSLLSSCPLMTTSDEELVSVRALAARGFRTDGTIQRTAVWDEAAMVTCAQALETAGVSHPWRYIAQLTVCATLAMQSDLHLGNCAIIRNVHTGVIRPAPLFDFGGCFGTGVDKRAIKTVTSAPRLASRYLAGRFRQLRSSWDYGWYDGHVLDGFRQQLEQCLLEETQLPAAYVSIVAEQFERQRTYVDDVARGSRET